MAHPFWSRRAIGCARARGRWVGWPSGRDRCPSSRPGSPTKRRAPAGCSRGAGLRVPLPGVRPRQGLGAGAGAADAPVRGVRAAGLGHRRHRAARQPPAAAHLVPGRLADGDPTPTASRPGSRGSSSGSAPTSRPGSWSASCAGRWSIPGASRSPAWPRWTRPRYPFAPRAGVGEPCPPFGAGGEPARPGRSHEGKLLVAGAVEIEGEGPGRVRLAVIDDYSAVALGAFAAAAVIAGSTVVSDGWPGYARLKEVKHDPKVIGDAPAHAVLPWIHRVFANAKRWALGVYHGLREKHLQAYLDEFVFRFNRRRTPQAAFSRLLGLAVTTGPHPYDALVASGSKG